MAHKQKSLIINLHWFLCWSAGRDQKGDKRRWERGIKGWAGEEFTCDIDVEGQGNWVKAEDEG